MAEIKFRKNVPIPEDLRYRGKWEDFGFEKMEVGDYNFVPKRSLNSFRNAASLYRTSEEGNPCFNVVYKERMEVPEGETEPVMGISYWRVKDHLKAFGGKKKANKRVEETT